MTDTSLKTPKETMPAITSTPAATIRWYAALTNCPSICRTVMVIPRKATSIWTSCNRQSCIAFYNHRGCEGEHHFKELDHDFGWNKLPFDNLGTNTVYMYMTVVAYLLFNVFKMRYAKRCSFVRVEMRLKNFILQFVTLTAK